MRDPKRIDRICDLLEVLWKQVPDWRLGQLISNVTEPRGLYFIEDEDMEKNAWILFKDCIGGKK